jgi:hypothetical protein
MQFDKRLAGTAAFRALCQQVDAIGDATAGRSGLEDCDDRDYTAIVAAIRASLATNLEGVPDAHATGYLLALADVLCTSLDGCNLDLRDPAWDPIKNVEAALARAH